MTEPSRGYKNNMRKLIGKLNPDTEAIQRDFGISALSFVFKKFEECRGNPRKMASVMAPYFRVRSKKKFYEMLKGAIPAHELAGMPEYRYMRIISGKKEHLSHEKLLVAQLAKLDLNGERKELTTSDLAGRMVEVIEKAAKAGIHSGSLDRIAEKILEFHTPEELKELGGITQENKLTRVKELLQEFFKKQTEMPPSRRMTTVFAHIVAGKTAEEPKGIGEIRERISSEYPKPTGYRVVALLSRLADIKDGHGKEIETLSQVTKETARKLRIQAHERFIDRDSLDGAAQEIAGLPLEGLQNIFEIGEKLTEENVKPVMWYRLLQFFIHETKIPKMQYPVSKFVKDKLRKDENHSDPLVRENVKRSKGMLE